MAVVVVSCYNLGNERNVLGVFPLGLRCLWEQPPLSISQEISSFLARPNEQALLMLGPVGYAFLQ